MRILIYKRTHNSDPDASGRFGSHDCMGRVRGLKFDAVIGVGGIGVEARSNHISGKLNWVGIGPRNYATSPRGPILTFDHFRHFGTHGPSMQEIAPELYKRVYGGRVRYMIVGLTAYEGELSRILAYAESSPRTRSRGKFRGVRPLCNTVPQCLPVCRRRHRS
jgi:hypothetical protein